ncbi:hypothetical protein BDP55DRAFT_631493 [Colletotrichum godetiae]|uniref:C2H2-type domain-containing protein n=1 Tax=Colletotrichum godetiae TaxID=1209918 RepID=A0AAJ0EYL0_9PEZI|nr:uncharacterized protein BDP55DRAFT_631493 [Colletotrichum godetiae]KAK1676330.1 hypothetical protein BDP55DRAFT_631493 [Colletotrichum godetiae]
MSSSDSDSSPMLQSPDMGFVLELVCYHKDCNAHFDDDEDRHAHEQTHLTCTHCDRGFESVADRVDHEAAHLTCYYGYCGLQFETEELREEHEESEESAHFSGNFRCTICGEAWPDAIQWRVCEASHNPRRPEIYWVCSEASVIDAKPCNTSFTSEQRDNFVTHLSSRHDHRSHTPGQLPGHILEKFCFKHSGFWCGYCGKGLKYDSPDIKRGLEVRTIDQPLRLDHIQKHVLEDGAIEWHWPIPGV